MKPTVEIARRPPGGGEATITRLKLVEAARQPAGLPGEPGEVITADRLAGDQPVDERRPLASSDHSAGTFANPQAHARHLIAIEGVRHRNELARRVRGLSHYRAAQLLDELAPGWPEKRRATKR